MGKRLGRRQFVAEEVINPCLHLDMRITTNIWVVILGQTLRLTYSSSHKKAERRNQKDIAKLHLPECQPWIIPYEQFYQQRSGQVVLITIQARSSKRLFTTISLLVLLHIGTSSQILSQGTTHILHLFLYTLLQVYRLMCYFLECVHACMQHAKWSMEYTIEMEKRKQQKAGRRHI